MTTKDGVHSYWEQGRQQGLRIGVDCDGVIADLLTPWLDAYNRQWLDKLTLGDIKGWGIQRFVKPECGGKVFDLIERPGFYESLSPIPGALPALRELKKLHDVTIVTASAATPNTAAEKLNWIRQHCGLSRKDVFIGHKKGLLRFDVFIDDSPEMIAEYRAAWPSAYIITIDYPYNRDAHSMCSFVAKDWTNLREAWAQIVNQVNVFWQACRANSGGEVPWTVGGAT